MGGIKGRPSQFPFQCIFFEFKILKSTLVLHKTMKTYTEVNLLNAHFFEYYYYYYDNLCELKISYKVRLLIIRYIFVKQHNKVQLQNYNISKSVE